MASSRAGLAFALGLGVASSVMTVGVLVVWLQVAGIRGMLVPEAGGVVATVSWWVALWVALTAGLLVALGASSRAWRLLYPATRRREAQR